MKIYVASSWRNRYQQDVVAILRTHAHDVYDFRNPAPGNRGFAWSQIDPDWTAWDPSLFREALKHPLAGAGFQLDRTAVETCDCCVLVLACGRSSHLEAGCAVGRGKPLIVYMPEPSEPELMYSWAIEIATNWSELVLAIGKIRVNRPVSQ